MYREGERLCERMYSTFLDCALAQNAADFDRILVEREGNTGILGNASSKTRRQGLATRKVDEKGREFNHNKGVGRSNSMGTEDNNH